MCVGGGGGICLLAANWGGGRSGKNVPSQHNCTTKGKIHNAFPARWSGCLSLSGSPSIRGSELLSNFNKIPDIVFPA